MRWRALVSLLICTFQHSLTEDWLSRTQLVYDAPEVYCFHFVFYSHWHCIFTSKWMLRVYHNWYGQLAISHYRTVSWQISIQYNFEMTLPDQPIQFQDASVKFYCVLPALPTVVPREMIAAINCNGTHALYTKIGSNLVSSALPQSLEIALILCVVN